MSLKSKIKNIVGKDICLNMSLFKYKIFNLLCAFLPMKNEIILESHPDLSCNTFEIYKLLIEKHVNEKYKLVWRVNDKSKYVDDKKNNVYFIDISPKGFFKRIMYYIRCNRATLSISCNRYLEKFKVSKKQLNIYIAHGSYLKECNHKNFSCGYYISQSSFFTDIIVDQTGICKNNILPLGLPRNDQLFRSNIDLKFLTGNTRYEKIFIWAPTFREHMNGVRVDCHSNFPLGLPIIYSNEDFQKLNLFLIKKKALLIFKPHPAQNLSVLKFQQFTNIKLITNEDLIKLSIQTNELLAKSDALIVDYSSIYYDYLLLDKPIAITLDDFEQYKKEKGIVFANPFDILKGYYVYNIDNLLDFINLVCDGTDSLIEERAKIKSLTNTSPYFGATQRLFDFIDDKIHFNR